MSDIDRIVNEIEQLRDHILKNNSCAELCGDFCAKLKGMIAGFERKNESQTRIPRVGFIGSFSSGKSSIINSILGREIVPVKVEPATCFPIVLKYGKFQNSCTIHMLAGDVEVITFDEFKQISTHNMFNDPERKNRILKVSHFEIQVKNEILKEIELVDFPGFLTAEIEDDTIVYGWIEKLDMIFWVSDINTGTLGAREMDVLNNIKTKVPNKIVAILNKADCLPDKSIKKIKNKFKEEFDFFYDTVVYSALDKSRFIEGHEQISSIFYETKLEKSVYSKKDNIEILRIAETELESMNVSIQKIHRELSDGVKINERQKEKLVEKAFEKIDKAMSQVKNQSDNYQQLFEYLGKQTIKTFFGTRKPSQEREYYKKKISNDYKSFILQPLKKLREELSEIVDELMDKSYLKISQPDDLDEIKDDIDCLINIFEDDFNTGIDAYLNMNEDEDNSFEYEELYTGGSIQGHIETSIALWSVMAQVYIYEKFTNCVGYPEKHLNDFSKFKEQSQKMISEILEIMDDYKRGYN